MGEKRQITVFAAEVGDLPPNTHLLIGNQDLIDLGLSLDYVQGHPGCFFSEALFDNLSLGRLFLPRLLSLVDASLSLFWPALSWMFALLFLAALVLLSLRQAVSYFHRRPVG